MKSTFEKRFGLRSSRRNVTHPQRIARYQRAQDRKARFDALSPEMKKTVADENKRTYNQHVRPPEFWSAIGMLKE